MPHTLRSSRSNVIDREVLRVAPREAALDLRCIMTFLAWMCVRPRSSRSSCQQHKKNGEQPHGQLTAHKGWFHCGTLRPPV